MSACISRVFQLRCGELLKSIRIDEFGSFEKVSDVGYCPQAIVYSMVYRTNSVVNHPPELNVLVRFQLAPNQPESCQESVNR